MQVFISYAHTPADTALAKCIAAALRAVGFRAWLDETQLIAGTELQARIEKGIAESDHGVFLLSPSWLNSKWTAFELAQFARRDPNVVRLIPIYRVPHRRLVIPPDFVKVLGFHWLDDDRDTDARLWELYSAVTGTPPGPSEEWAARWRAVPKHGPEAKFEPPAALTLVRTAPRLRPSLMCDRAVQWSAVDDLALEPSNRLIILPGSVGQDHDHFIQRVQNLLRQDPPRSMVTVDWPTRPRSEGEFLENLAAALNVEPASLPAEICRRLVHENLVLLHPVVRARYVDPELVAYYTTYLPGLLAEAKGAMALKCVQPIEWPVERGGVTRLFAGLGLMSSPVGEEGRSQAEELMRNLVKAQVEVLRVFKLRDLTNVTTPDVVDFCAKMNLREAQAAWLLAQIEARRARMPKEMFQAIDDFLPDARSIA